jgi:cytoskeleton protein RodZ
MQAETTKSEHFGRFLQKGRQARGMTIVDLSRATKIKENVLENIEGAFLEKLPGQVYVRGFVLAYAREVGLDANEALTRLRMHIARLDHREPEVTVPHKAIVPAPLEPDELGPLSRRRMGVVMVVLLILVVATLTLSLLLRHGPGAGAGLS